MHRGCTALLENRCIFNDRIRFPTPSCAILSEIDPVSLRGRKHPGTPKRSSRYISGGQVLINQYFAGGVETPFGATKNSGFGREKGLEGLSDREVDEARSYVRHKNSFPATTLIAQNLRSPVWSGRQRFDQVFRSHEFVLCKKRLSDPKLPGRTASRA